MRAAELAETATPGPKLPGVREGCELCERPARGLHAACGRVGREDRLVGVRRRPTAELAELGLRLIDVARKRKEKGTVRLDELDPLGAFSYRVFTDVLEWDVDEVDVLLAEVRGDLKNKTIHAVYNW